MESRKWHSQDTQPEDTVNVKLQPRAYLATLHHEERDEEKQHIDTDCDAAKRISHIELSHKWLTLPLGCWIDECPCVADRDTLDEKIDTEHKTNTDIEDNSCPEKGDVDLRFCPFEESDGNACFHDACKDHIDELEEPNRL